MVSKALIFLLLAASSLPSLAQVSDDKKFKAPSAHFSGKTLDDMIRLEAELEMLNKRSAIIDMQRRMEASPEQTLPSVASIIVNGGSAVARVVYANGMSRFIAVGDTVGGDYVVTSVTTDGVEVAKRDGSKKGVQKRRLPFGPPSTTPQSAPTPTPFMLPPPR